MKSFYADDEIKSRFDEFGGIIRYVLPVRQSVLDSIRRKRNELIGELDLKRLFVSPNIENGKISHLIVKVIIITIIIIKF